MNSKNTLDGLPIVSKETIEVFLEDFRGDKRRTIGNRDYIKDLIERLHQENPALVELPRALSNRKFANYQLILVGVCATYESLRRQYESNKLKEA